jgi:transposase-like protein
MRTTGTLSTLAKLIPNEDAAIAMLESLRWPNGAACPHCGGADPHRVQVGKASAGKRAARKGLWRCTQCQRQFTVKVGTVFEQSHIPVSKWLMAIHLLAASKKGMSAHQFHRMLGLTYRAAWFMAHRLRHAMSVEGGLFAKLDGTVEVDEVYIGPRRRRMGDREYKPKMPVIGLVERGGRARLFPVENVNQYTLKAAVDAHVSKKARIVTDDLPTYVGPVVGAREHETVVHSKKEYVRGDIHTNTVEGFFGLLKRGITGSFHHVSKGHLHRYCDEFEFRYNRRDMTDGERAAEIVTGAEGKRLTYKKGSGTRAA